MNPVLFQRYIGRGIWSSSLMVLLSFLAMFLFFDFLAETDEVGTGGYSYQLATLFILLGVPNRIVELAPIAVLIGTLWALSQSAVNSEFTVFRVSGLLPRTALNTLWKAGLPLVVITVLLSEVVAPYSESLRSQIRDGSLGISSAQMRSGLWLRDATVSPSNAERLIRFVNMERYTVDQTLQRVRIYDFDQRLRLVSVVRADSGLYQGQQNGQSLWAFSGVRISEFAADGKVQERVADSLSFASTLSPEMLSALVTNPDRMSSLDLYHYVQYLQQNKQDYGRYETAMWKRVFYPFSIWVMMFLALPVAFLQARAGAVGARVFVGILVGVGFHLVNSLFSHLGVLTTLSPVLLAILPSLIALAVASFFFYWVQYR